MEGKTVDHINHIRNDNRVENLRWYYEDKIIIEQKNLKPIDNLFKDAIVIII